MTIGIFTGTASGRSILERPRHDLIIAATAVFLGYSVATRDLRSFPRIRGLTVLRW